MRPIELIDPKHNLNKAQGICTTCGGKVGQLKDALSLKEWSISGMCQKCQDATFGSQESINDYGY